MKKINKPFCRSEITEYLRHCHAYVLHRAGSRLFNDPYYSNEERNFDHKLMEALSLLLTHLNFEKEKNNENKKHT